MDLFKRKNQSKLRVKLFRDRMKVESYSENFLEQKEKIKFSKWKKRLLKRLSNTDNRTLIKKFMPFKHWKFSWLLTNI